MGHKLGFNLPHTQVSVTAKVADNKIWGMDNSIRLITKKFWGQIVEWYMMGWLKYKIPSDLLKYTFPVSKLSFKLVNWINLSCLQVSGVNSTVCWKCQWFFVCMPLAVQYSDVLFGLIRRALLCSLPENHSTCWSSDGTTRPVVITVHNTTSSVVRAHL